MQRGSRRRLAPAVLALLLGGASCAEGESEDSAGSARGVRPCLELSPELVDFGSLELGSISPQRMVDVVNPCRGVLEINDYGLLDESCPFEVGSLDQAWLDPGEGIRIPISLRSDQSGAWQTHLWLDANDLDVALGTVELRGEVLD